MEKIKVDIRDLKRFLAYLQDKVEDCYKEETKEAIDEYIREIKGSNNGKQSSN
jgi:hypothetical protein